MDLTKFGIWLEVSKSQRVRVQASVKVKIDHKRQQNTIFFECKNVQKIISPIAHWDKILTFVHKLTFDGFLKNYLLEFSR